jgi:serine protease AprX
VSDDAPATPSSPEDPEVLEQARAAARRELGSALEGKASDAFCLALAGTRPRDPRLAPALETAAPVTGAVAPAVRAVVEFEDLPESVGRLPSEVSEVAAAALQQGLDGVVEEVGAPDKALALLLRQAAVKAARDDFYRSVGAVRDRIERSAAALSQPEALSERIGIAAAPVQACWLNRSVRAQTDPRVLGDIAEDASVVRVDVPRLLRPDAVPVDVTLEAAATVRAEHSLSGNGVTVGVIDSEVAAHPALQDRVIHRRNYTQEPFGTPAEHGTAVAGFVAARSDEFTGIAPDATIYNYKVLATVSALNADDFGGALAIQHALEDGIRVVNCSWGAGPASDGRSREARACDTAWRLGLTIVKSAGNRGPGARTLTTPADAEGVIAVGATDRLGGEIASYSSRGPTTDGRHRPHLVAPGGTFDEGLFSATDRGGFADVGAGTSYAAPHVAGLVALLLERDPELMPDQQRERLLAACAALEGVDEDSQGAGLVWPERLF